MRHGNGGYAEGCRCWDCKAGRREYMRRYRAGHRGDIAPGKREGPKAKVDHDRFWDVVRQTSRLRDLERISAL